MWIYLFAGVVIIGMAMIFFTRKHRRVERRLAKKINIKPSLVSEMMVAMGPDRGHLFVEHMLRGDPSDHSDVYTFIVFQTMKNDRRENILWWKTKLEKHGIDPHIDMHSATQAFMYLRDAGADVGQSQPFVDVYNSIS